MDKHKILFLHGWLFDSRIWFGLDELFSKENQTILIDLPGYGKNKESKSNIRDYCKEIFSNQTSPTVLISWSFGGTLALLSLSKNYPFIKKVVIINSHLRLMNYMDENSEINLKNINNMKEDLASDREKTLKKFFFQCIKGSSEELNDYKLLTEKFNLSTLPDNKILIDGLDDIININCYNNLRDTKKEVLIISGSKDHLVGKKLYPEFKNNKNISFCSLQNIPHIPFISFKRELVDTIRKFI
tara:strand:+ start:24753 stop:25481 length:729 start_codon:yes stop_codon:yes gene_type:complete